MPDKSETGPKPASIAVAHGVAIDQSFGAVVPPLYLSITFKFDGFDAPREYDYGRAGNPTRDPFARALAKLEAERVKSSLRAA